ncbi:hypothetical protein Pth03_50060 [Planotetraspora thailandica]|uniref:Uncharacterized protein n=1 Tax=Planotetraspora thailandica TaxID=487172 RepID=A0A8J3XVJ4_9ACTN|nr:hypothetical protein [Planotetraspora thailandica]GII56617.1 hypothetical protein Pth03_50060 [Planotetraspora thailandica]
MSVPMTVTVPMTVILGMVSFVRMVVWEVRSMAVAVLLAFVPMPMAVSLRSGVQLGSMRLRDRHGEYSSYDRGLVSSGGVRDWNVRDVGQPEIQKHPDV